MAAATALVVAVAGFTVALNAGASQAPVSDVAPDGKRLVSPNKDVQYEPLVSRMLADLVAGRAPESQDRPLAGAPVKLVRAGPDNPVPIAELRIPAIGLVSPVFEGVYEDALLNGPGHWPGTPGLGEPGNSVISGHRSTQTRPFLYLDRLRRGDTITFHRGTERLRYEVDSVTIVPERRYVPYVLKQPTGPRARMVTLFACNPLTAHFQRIVVRAHAVRVGSRT
jgi:sortase A